MASPNVSQEVKDPTVYTGKVNKKIENIFSGTEVPVKGTFSLPLAQTMQDVLSLSKGNEADIVFWFNHGRKLQARTQVTSKLTFDLDDKNLNSLYKTLKNTTNQLADDNSTPAERKALIEFIMKQKKFAPLQEKLAQMETATSEAEHFDFSSVELVKPTGKKGAPKKIKDPVTGAETEVDSDDDSDSDDTEDES